jgi:hypothetical protein
VIAHYGAGVARKVVKLKLEDIAVRAASELRHDPALARMFPTFLWRVRHELDLSVLEEKAHRQRCAAILGYFLEVASKLGGDRCFENVLPRLRSHARAAKPVYLFAKTAKNPFEAMVADRDTPVEAKRWGLVTGMPTDSFESYFQKVADI